jgi:hypothetical protein
MKTIIAKTKKAYDAKLKELDRLFKKLNPQFQREPLPGGEFYRPKGIYRFPSKYPTGVELVLKKKCPFCLEQKEYYEIHWSLDQGGFFHISPDFNALAELGEFKRLNPGICRDCIFTHHSGKKHQSPSASNSRSADKGGFWGSLFS